MATGARSRWTDQRARSAASRAYFRGRVSPDLFVGLLHWFSKIRGMLDVRECADGERTEGSEQHGARTGFTSRVYRLVILFIAQMLCMNSFKLLCVHRVSQGGRHHDGQPTHLSLRLSLRRRHDIVLFMTALKIVVTCRGCIGTLSRLGKDTAQRGIDHAARTTT